MSIPVQIVSFNMKAHQTYWYSPKGQKIIENCGSWRQGNIFAPLTFTMKFHSWYYCLSFTAIESISNISSQTKFNGKKWIAWLPSCSYGSRRSCLADPEHANWFEDMHPKSLYVGMIRSTPRIYWPRKRLPSKRQRDHIARSDYCLGYLVRYFLSFHFSQKGTPKILGVFHKLFIC